MIIYSFFKFSFYISTTILPPTPCPPPPPLPPSTPPKGLVLPWGINKAWAIKLRQDQASHPLHEV